PGCARARAPRWRSVLVHRMLRARGSRARAPRRTRARTIDQRRAPGSVRRVRRQLRTGLGLATRSALARGHERPRERDAAADPEPNRRPRLIPERLGLLTRIGAAAHIAANNQRSASEPSSAV